MIGKLNILILIVASYSTQAISIGNIVKLTNVLSNIKYLDELLIVSVATNETDGYHRFIRSLNIYGYQYEVLIMLVY